MSVWEFDELAPLIHAVGMAQARDEVLDLDALSAELGQPREVLEGRLDQLDRMGLVHAPAEEPGEPPMLTRAGSQYLARKGEIRDEVLHFLAKTIDDLHGREALLRGGTILIDEFRHQLIQGGAVSHARQLVPEAFEAAVDERLAVDMFAAAVGLIARLSCDCPAGCVAEEIVAVTLLETAEAHIDSRREAGELDEEEARSAERSLRGIFALFEDDDVLDMFDMQEPGDAALAGHTWFNQQAGVADQRVEAWFRPFGGTAGTGHLHERV